MSDNQVNVVFLVQPGDFRHEAAYSIKSRVDEVKISLSEDLDIPIDHVSLYIEDNLLNDEQTLEDLGDTEGSKTNIIINVNLATPPDESKTEYRRNSLPEIIDVNICDSDGNPTKIISVAIEKEASNKLYLGGYRNRNEGTEYHHAVTQTRCELKEDISTRPPKFHRETQTYDLKTRSAQSNRERGTQMKRKDLHLDETKDKLITVGRYFNSHDLSKLKYEKTIVIQCYWRGYKARCLAAKLRSGLEDKKRRVSEIKELKQAEAEDRHKKEIERRMRPKSHEDFEILYDELESWRLHETNRINDAGMEEEERLAALAQLLNKETKLLQTIDRLKISANKDNREIKIKKMLELMAAPKKWAMSDGEVASVHTPFTTRSRELLELHNGLNLSLLTIDERLDVLLHVKWTVKEFDCNLTREIVELIDREADLLNRGRNEKSLEGLRLRISRSFLQFIETPEFNPEAARFQRVPRELLNRPNVAPINSRRK